MYSFHNIISKLYWENDEEKIIYFFSLLTKKKIKNHVSKITLKVKPSKSSYFTKCII